MRLKLRVRATEKISPHQQVCLLKLKLMLLCLSFAHAHGIIETQWQIVELLAYIKTNQAQVPTSPAVEPMIDESLHVVTPVNVENLSTTRPVWPRSQGYLEKGQRKSLCILHRHEATLLS